MEIFFTVIAVLVVGGAIVVRLWDLTVSNRGQQPSSRASSIASTPAVMPVPAPVIVSTPRVSIRSRIGGAFGAAWATIAPRRNGIILAGAIILVTVGAWQLLPWAWHNYSPLWLVLAVLMFLVAWGLSLPREWETHPARRWMIALSVIIGMLFIVKSCGLFGGMFTDDVVLEVKHAQMERELDPLRAIGKALRETAKIKSLSPEQIQILEKLPQMERDIRAKYGYKDPTSYLPTELPHISLPSVSLPAMPHISFPTMPDLDLGDPRPFIERMRQRLSEVGDVPYIIVFTVLIVVIIMTALVRSSGFRRFVVGALMVIAVLYVIMMKDPLWKPDVPYRAPASVSLASLDVYHQAVDVAEVGSIVRYVFRLEEPLRELDVSFTRTQWKIITLDGREPTSLHLTVWDVDGRTIYSGFYHYPLEDEWMERGAKIDLSVVGVASDGYVLFIKKDVSRGLPR
ncbi:MAG: hypothetical protein AAB372_01820 [Patescibacteria group bacterium]